VTGHSYSLVDMQSGAVANDLAFVEYDFGLIKEATKPRKHRDDVVPILVRKNRPEIERLNGCITL
jgi:hypothetical protein